MTAVPSNHRRTKFARQRRHAEERRNVCLEPGCNIGFKRRSDLERHRKCVHRLRPEVGDSSIYRCRALGCDAERSRLDHFKKHARQAHPDWYPLDLARKSAVVLTINEDYPTTASVAQPLQRYTAVTPASHLEYRVDAQLSPNDCNDDQNEFDDTFPERGGLDTSYPPSRTPLLSKASSYPGARLDNHTRQPRSGRKFQTDALVSRAVVDLLHRIRAKHLEAVQLHPTTEVKHPPEDDGCDAPADGESLDQGLSSGQFGGLPCSGGGGYGNAGGSGKGKQPMRDPDDGRDGRGDGGGDPPNGDPQGTPGDRSKIYPCVYCLFHVRGVDPTRDCSTRKPHICNLWPHHYRHGFNCCWRCFRVFGTRAELEEHRSPVTCEALCVTTNCPNYDAFPSGTRRCNHGNSNNSIAVWRRLYRQAHRLTRDDWVPDPTRTRQNVPRGLPSHHPISRFSRPSHPDNHNHTPSASDSLPLPVHQTTNLLAGQGDWINDQRRANSLPHAAARPALTQPTTEDRLRCILAGLWDRVNTRVPSWGSTLARDQFWSSMPQGIRQRFLADYSQDFEETSQLEYQAIHLALLIEGEVPRTLDTWGLANEIAAGRFPDHVVYPMGCPWDLSRPQRPFIGRAELHAPQIDPALLESSQSSLPTLDNMSSFAASQSSVPTMNDIQNFTSNIDRHQHSIPRVTQNAITEAWVTRQTDTLTPQRALGSRRVSFASPTSPSEGPFYSAHSQSSFVLTPAGNGTPLRSHQQQTLDPIDQFMPDPDEMEDDIDFEGLD